MLFAYIILGIIFILFITLVILFIKKYNNEQVDKELEYISENYDVNEINENPVIVNDLNTKSNTVVPKKEETVVPSSTVVPTKTETVVPTKVEERTPPPVIDLKVPELSDEEIVIEDNALKEETTSESIEIKDNALNEEETGEEINITDNALKVEEDGISAIDFESLKEPKVEPVTIPKQEVNYAEQAFGNNFDGNTEINKNIKYETPHDVSMKTEIWDFSDIINGDYDEKN